MHETPRRVGGRYDLGEILGSGGMADVHRAHDTVLGRDVAVKLLRTGSAVDRERFASEARLLALLAHENVVTVLDTGLDDGRPWLALELVDGDTLADRLRPGPMAPSELARIGAQVASALDHAHSQGVVHRDVKPSNVLLGAGGRARLTDFGIARLVDGASLTMTGHTIGTAAFLAPEQVSGGPVTTATDVYALGLVLLEGVTGRREYDGTPVEAALARLHRSPLVPVSLPTGWPALISAMTLSAPEDRPPAAVVARRLDELSRRDDVLVVPADDATAAIAFIPPARVVPAAPAAAAAGAPPHTRRVLVAVAAAVALVLAMSAFLIVGPSGGDAPTAAAGTASRTATPTRTAAKPKPTPTPTRSATAAPVEPVVAAEPSTPPPPRARPRRPAAKPSTTRPTRQAEPPAKSNGKSNGKGGGKSKGKSGGKSKGGKSKSRGKN